MLRAVGTAAVVGLLASGSAAQEASTQDGTPRCDLMENQYVRSIVASGGDRINYISGPVLLRCDDGLRVEADSVVEFTASQFRQLIGDVVMDGPESRMRADRIHYFADVGRIQAWGGVDILEKADSLRIVGDTLLLLRQNSFRDQDLLSVRGEDAHALIRIGGGPGVEETPDPAVADSTAADTARLALDSVAVEAPTAVPDTADPGTAGREAPDSVYARRIYLEGESRFAAADSVRIVSADVVTHSDSADYRRDVGMLTLLSSGGERSSRVVGDAYELTSGTIDIQMGGQGLREVEARDEAVLAGQDIRLTAPVVRIFLTRGEIDRLVAVRGGEEEVDSLAPRQAEALAEDFHLRADSIEVVAPGQRLRTVFAAGEARGEALGRDSLNTPDTPDLIRTDWIEGDSVLATFIPNDPPSGSSATPDGAPGSDSTRARFRLEELMATGSARSLYRLVRPDSAAADTAAGTDAAPAPEGASQGSESVDTASVDTASAAGPRLAIHYVTGRKITITLERGEVQEMQVDGQTRGLYLEPGRFRSTTPVPDTTSAGGTGPGGRP